MSKLLVTIWLMTFSGPHRREMRRPTCQTGLDKRDGGLADEKEGEESKRN